jgi:copper chaperone CopZ
MKKIRFLFLLSFIFFLTLHQAMAQSSSEATATKVANTVTTKFKVWGNCGMCKRTIQKSLKTNGVKFSDWNVDTKMLTVSYSPKKITEGDLHKRIAAVGYDTEKERAANEVYDKLHSCCQYEREKQ